MACSSLAPHARSSGKSDHARVQLLIQAFRHALADDIRGRQPQTGQDTLLSLPLRDGRQQHRTGRTSYFLFQSDPIPPTLLEDNTPSLVLDSARFPCRVIGFSLDGLALAIDAELASEIPQAHLAFDAMRLMHTLEKRLTHIARQPDRFGTLLALRAFDPDTQPHKLASASSVPGPELSSEQAQAYTYAHNHDVSFVLGPPGTGKTGLIAALSVAFKHEGRRTLICSATNTAIDHIVDTILERHPELTEGSFVRVGSPSPDSTDCCQMVNLDALVLSKTIPLQEEATRLRAQLQELERDLTYAHTAQKMMTAVETVRAELLSVHDRIQALEHSERILTRTIEERALTLEDIHFSLEELEQLPAVFRLFRRPSQRDLLEQYHTLQYTQQEDQARIHVVRTQLPFLRQELARHREAIATLTPQLAWDTTVWTSAELAAVCASLEPTRHALEQRLRQTEQQIAHVDSSLVAQSQIVATTLTRTYTSRLLEEQRFDTVILEEASMGLSPAVFAALCLATTRVIIVGDFLQLAPISTVRTDATRQWLARNIYQIAGITSGQDPRVVALSTQFRMHPSIARVASRLYARAGLQYRSATHLAADREALIASAPAPGEALIFLDTTKARPATLRDRKGSPVNLYHALLAVRVAKQALNTVDHVPSLSIIAPYRAQVDLIQRIVRHEGLDHQVRVGTVHRFQGRQSDIVIFDTVNTDNITRSMLGCAFEDATPHLLINVAVTRAKGKLVVIGHGEALALLQHSPEPILWECIEVARQDGLAVSACTILPALPFQMGTSVLDSDTALAAVLSSVKRIREPLHTI